MAPRKRAREPTSSQDDATNGTPASSQPTTDPEPLSTSDLNNSTITPSSTPSSATLKLVHSKTISPDPSGVISIAVHPNGTQLCIARENGSLQSYEVDTFQNVVHLNGVRRTGGQMGRGITKIAYVGPKLLLVAYHSGQMVLVSPTTLLPAFVLHRQGGTVYDIAVSGHTVVAASADGTWKTFQVVPRRNGGVEMEYLRSTPKVSGSERALSVAVSSSLQLAVGGDDGGNIVAWRVSLQKRADMSGSELDGGSTAQEEERVLEEVRDQLRRENYQQQWCARTPKGVPLAVAIADPKGANQPAAVAVATTVGDVHILDIVRGTFLHTFSQHRGPLSTIIFDVQQGCFYASGWHEALRSYRYAEDEESWYPAEAKRRTHYHECTQLAVSDKLQVLFSAARDGTVLHAPTATIFSAPAHYVDTTPQCFAFAPQKDILLQTRAGNRIEAFRLLRGDWVPTFSLQLRGEFQVHSLWCDREANYVVVASDVHVQISRVEWASNGLVVDKIVPLLRRDAVGVSDAQFSADGKSLYLLTPFSLLHVMLDLNGAVADMSLRGLASKSAAIHNNKQQQHAATSAIVMHRLVATPERLFLYGDKASCLIPLEADGTFAPLPEGSSAPAVQQGNAVHLAGQTEGFHVELRGKHHQLHFHEAQTASQSSMRKLSRTLPHDAAFEVLCDDGASLVGTFGKGLLSSRVDGEGWNMMKRMQVAAAFPMKEPGSMLVLERNVEGTVEALPLCWKVRRFGN